MYIFSMKVFVEVQLIIYISKVGLLQHFLQLRKLSRAVCCAGLGQGDGEASTCALALVSITSQLRLQRWFPFISTWNTGLH